jgi:pimeloyl-ACP methyl ester carboxylesterase
MGLGGSMEDWDPTFVDALARRYRVIAFDNAGVGRTQAVPGPLTIDAMARQTSALIASLRLGRSDVLGWSLGGMVAQALAVQDPSQVRRIVLCATQAGTGRALPPPPAAAAAVASGNPSAVLATLFPADQMAAAGAYATGVISYPTRAAVSRATVVAQTKAIARWLRGAEPAGARVATVSVPTLVADGTVDALDPVSNDRELASLIRHARLLLYRDAGHGFLFQDQAAFLPRVESFLR